jgi:hypothetical protein
MEGNGGRLRPNLTAVGSSHDPLNRSWSPSATLAGNWRTVLKKALSYRSIRGRHPDQPGRESLYRGRPGV